MGSGTSEALAFGDDLVLIERLAMGGMAEVWRARQTGAGGFERIVAVKRILPSFAADDEFKAMFESEVALCARLQHPNIVQVFSTGAFDGYLYLVMEFIHGQNVGRTIRTAGQQRQFLPPPLVAYVVSESAKGLDHAHRHTDEVGRSLRVVHRDVSPQNIMVSYDGQVKVVDFGIAKAADRAELTAPGQVKGKVAYMSPEQIRGESLDGRSDVFSLGVVLWEMLAGRRLFKADNAAAITQRVLKMTVRAPSLHNPSIHAELDAIVLRALERSLQTRYPSALDLHKDLVGFLGRRHAGYIHTDVASVMRALFEEELTAEVEQFKSKTADLPTVTPSHGRLAATPIGETTIDPTPPSMTNHPSTVNDATVLANSYPIPTMMTNAIPSSRSPWVVLGILFIVFGGAFAYFRQTAVAAHIPSDYQGLTAWYQASSIGAAPGATIEAWTDDGPMRVAAVQPDAERRPRYFAAAGAVPAFVRFDGYDDFMAADELAVALRRATGMTAFWVARLRRPQRQYVWAVHGQDRVRDVIRGGFSETGAIRTKVTPRPGVRYADAKRRASVDRVAVYGLRVDGTQMELYMDGELILQRDLEEALHFFDSTYMSIGQEWDNKGPSDFLAGDIMELILYDRSLENEERSSVELYLLEHYGVKD